MKQKLREILYRSHKSIKNKRRSISVTERCENAQSSTRVRKILVYKISSMDNVPALEEPVVFVTKMCDTKTKRERFIFRVKGMFYVTEHDDSFIINFCHSLLVDIVPKAKAHQ